MDAKLKSKTHLQNTLIFGSVFWAVGFKVWKALTWHKNFCYKLEKGTKKRKISRWFSNPLKKFFKNAHEKIYKPNKFNEISKSELLLMFIKFVLPISFLVHLKKNYCTFVKIFPRIENNTRSNFSFFSLLEKPIDNVVFGWLISVIFVIFRETMILLLRFIRYRSKNTCLSFIPITALGPYVENILSILYFLTLGSLSVITRTSRIMLLGCY